MDDKLRKSVLSRGCQGKFLHSSCVLCGKDLCFNHSRSYPIEFQYWGEHNIKLTHLIDFCPSCSDKVTDARESIANFCIAKGEIKELVIFSIKKALGIEA